MKYIKGLDTVRAFAVIFVILWHWYPRAPIDSTIGFLQHMVIPSGETGVTLFFVLSGFLITTILLKAKSETDNNLGIIKNFMIRRSLRIFPIYYIFLGFLLLLKYPIDIKFLGYFLTYTSNFLVIKEKHWVNYTHTWSLSVEEQFYLIWPWLVLYIRNDRLKYLFLSFIVGAVASVAIYHYVLHMEADPIFTTCCFDAFGIGGLYAYCNTNPELYVRLKKYLKIALPIALAIYYAWRVVPYFGIEPKLNIFQRTVDSVISIWIIDLVINNKNEWVRRHILEQKFLNTIGKISYGIYLFHTCSPFVLNKLIFDPLISAAPWTERFIHNVVIGEVLQYTGLFFMCYLSFTFIENKIMKLKNRFNYTDK